MKNLYNSEKEDSGFTLISYRSLYLLKKKFEKYNSDINKLYTFYFFKDKNNHNNIRHKIIKISSFKQLLEEVLNLTNISILKITSLNELFTSNLIPENERQEKVNKTIDEINNFILDKIQKYNEIYYNKNLKREIQLNLIEDTLNNYTDYCTIIEYNKKGKIINSFEEIKKINKENEGILKLNEMTIQEEYELILKEENILYIETIPIIIADFIHLNPQYIIISNENDDIDLNKEIKGLFDEEILKRIERDNEDLNEKISNLSQKKGEMENQHLLKQQKEIDKKIKTFETILRENKKDGNNIQYLKDFIDKLKEEKKKLNEKINNNEKGLFKKYKSKTNIIDENDNKEIENKNNNMNNIYKMKVNKEPVKPVKILDNIPLKKKIFLKKNEVDDNLYEIFNFYANHQKNKLNSRKFNEMAYKKEILNFEEFSKFLIDFDIKIQKESLIQLYNKNSTNKLMTFTQFKQLFWKIALPMNDFKKDKLLLKIKHLKERIKQIKSEDSQNNKNILYDETINEDQNNNNKIENTENEIKNNEKEYKRLNDLHYDKVQIEFNNHVGISEPNIYREKMKGFYDLKERNCQINLFTKFEKSNLIKSSCNFNKTKLNKNPLIKKGGYLNFVKKVAKSYQNKDNSNFYKEERKKEILNEENEENSLKENDKENIENKKEIELKKEEEKLEEEKKVEEEENEKKEIIEEKRKLIFSYEETEKSPKKDFVDENEKKFLLIDRDNENSDDKVLNRFENLHENLKEVEKNPNNRYRENVKLIAKRILYIEEKENKEEENDLQNKRKNSFNSINKVGKSKLGNHKTKKYKSSSNIKNLEDDNSEYSISSKKIKKEITAYQQFNFNSKNKSQRNKTLINAGSSIIDSSNNFNNEQHTSFLNSNRQKNNNNLDSSKINQKNQFINPKILKLLK